MNDPTDYLQRILSELHDIERLMYKGYEFDITEYNINGSDDITEPWTPRNTDV